MPRHVRNFWIDARIDGRIKNLGGGPKGKDGGFLLEIYQRRDGSVIRPCTIEGRVLEDRLELEICLHEGEQVESDLLSAERNVKIIIKR